MELNEQESAQYNNTIKLCCEIEKEMHTTVDPTVPQQVQQQLSVLIPYLSNLSTMVATSTELYDTAKGRVSDLAMQNENILKAKQDVQRKWFEGKLAKVNALYVRVESLSKNLRSSVEGLRSLLSYEKELANMNKFNSHEH